MDWFWRDILQERPMIRKSMVWVCFRFIKVYWFPEKKQSIEFLDIHDRIGLRENLQETIDFPIKYGSFL